MCPTPSRTIVASGTAAGDGYEFVCYGHHHEREVSETGRTTILNLGAHVLAADDDPTVAIVDTRLGSVQFRSVCA
ncbi:phosphodiesterase, MJ0936 family protein [Natrinema gari JCM 14663]|uniref:Phosphodiesterase, MJ0936 family protein n=1 Tax=Natrinema gari JCM 14663 TaxID=1230459 RepID=L9Z0U8_9EURY|nr:phosphodiesterase, MJ0936 family protein [Natrinema gari JCM 14663]